MASIPLLLNPEITPMKKLKLDLEDLTIASFVTGEGLSGRGTIQGHSAGWLCQGVTLFVSAFGWSCDPVAEAGKLAGETATN